MEMCVCVCVCAGGLNCVSNSINCVSSTLIVYKCIHKFAPEYFFTLLSSPHRSNYRLRSSEDTSILHVSRVNSKKGEADFDFCGPKVWNSLPAHLRWCTS